MSNKKNKTEAIVLRVNQEMKAQIQKLADASRREVSDYLRLILEDVIKNQVKV